MTGPSDMASSAVHPPFAPSGLMANAHLQSLLTSSPWRILRGPTVQLTITGVLPANKVAR